MCAEDHISNCSMCHMFFNSRSGTCSLFVDTYCKQNFHTHLLNQQVCLVKLIHLFRVWTKLHTGSCTLAILAHWELHWYLPKTADRLWIGSSCSNEVISVSVESNQNDSTTLAVPTHVEMLLQAKLTTGISQQSLTNSSDCTQCSWLTHFQLN